MMSAPDAQRDLTDPAPAGPVPPAPAPAGPVPPAAPGHWCVITLRGRWGRSNPWPSLSFQTDAGTATGPPHFLGRVAGVAGAKYRAVIHVPAGASRYRLDTMGPSRSGIEATLVFRPVSRVVATLLLLAMNPRALARLSRLAALGETRRIRTVLASLAGTRNRPDDYNRWVRAFDIWPARPSDPAWSGASIAALVFHHGKVAAPLEATLASLAAQGVPMPHAVLSGASSADWHAAAAALGADYIALIQAGEVLPPHAAWYAGGELLRLGHPALSIADEDTLGLDGGRSDPKFRPMPGRVLMLSGTLTRGVWFVRRDILLAHPRTEDPKWAECLRFDVWRHRYEQGQADAHRIPMILTHRGLDTETAPVTVLAAAVNEHLRATGMPLRVEPAFPLLPRASPAPVARPVSILIPSTLRTPLSERCILSILRATAHRDFNLVVGVSQPGPLDDGQREAAARIAADPRARVVHLPIAAFNFSQVCNKLAAMTTDATILLMNDDLSVIDPGWLDELIAWLSDPAIGIAGARVLYPDRTIQHGGIAMGLGGLCDHFHRHLPGATTRDGWLPGLARDLSAVTGACLLVRRSIYAALGGLDETYPSAFNDVDFCLRAREAGHAVAYAAAAELIHHEMVTYGSHYHGERAPFEAEEIARMQRRWAAAIADDPFHNPNLDLVAGWETRPAFPPRRPLP